MADNVQVRQEKDAHLGLRFWVAFDGNLEIAGFSECSGLSAETEVFEYVEGGENTFTHKLPVRRKFGNITLKRGIDPGQDLFSWFAECLDGKVTRKNISIMVYGPEPNKEAVYQWNLKNAFPVKWAGPDLKSDAGAVAVETLEIAHEGLELAAKKKNG